VEADAYITVVWIVTVFRRLDRIARNLKAKTA
jgi:hypothetical protein